MPYTREQINEACLETMRQNGLQAAYPDRWCSWAMARWGLGAMDPPVRVGVAAYVSGDTTSGDEGIAKGIRQISSFGRNNMSGGVCPRGKIAGQYEPVLAKREVIKAGYDEAIMPDGNGSGGGSDRRKHLYAVIRGRLVTPPRLRSDPGRHHPRLGDHAGARPWASRWWKSRSRAISSCWRTRSLTGTVAEVTPVREIDDRPIGNGEAGTDYAADSADLLCGPPSGQLHPYCCGSPIQPARCSPSLAERFREWRHLSHVTRD